MRCRRHALSVSGLAWAPDSTYLASCSLDGDAIVWSAATGDCIAVLSGHTSFVKGIAWDPVNSYIATISEDRCACCAYNLYRMTAKFSSDLGKVWVPTCTRRVYRGGT